MFARLRHSHLCYLYYGNAIMMAQRQDVETLAKAEQPNGGRMCVGIGLGDHCALSCRSEQGY